MCLETISQHYCGHTTTTKQVCQAAHVNQHVKNHQVKKKSFISKLFRPQSTCAECKIARVEQKLYTVCQRCFQNPELRQFIERIPMNVSDRDRMGMIAAWIAQQEWGQLRRDETQADLNARRLERSYRNFKCSRCSRLPRSKDRLPNGMCCNLGQREYDRKLEAARIGRAERDKTRKVLPPFPTFPAAQPQPPAAPLAAQTRTRPGQVQRTAVGRQVAPTTTAGSATATATATTGSVRQEEQPKPTPKRSRRLASPSKYLHPGGYQRNTSPPIAVPPPAPRQQTPDPSPRYTIPGPQTQQPNPQSTSRPLIPPSMNRWPPRSTSLAQLTSLRRQPPRARPLQRASRPAGGDMSARVAEMSTRVVEDGPMRSEIEREIDELERIVRGL